MRATALLLLPLLLIGPAACAKSETPTSTVSDLDQQIRYARCMRDHGVPMPDPTGDGAHGGGLNKDALDPTVAASAQAACRSSEPVMPPDLAALKAELTREFSRCMRAHGVENFPDPGPDGRVDDIPLPVRDDPQYEQAKPLCDQHVREYHPSMEASAK